jgi:uncharacterized protein
MNGLEPSPAAEVRVLVVAKAPVPGRVKTRLGATLGMEQAARLAAAALLDTVAAATEAVGAARCVLALDGDLGSGPHGAALTAAVAGWTVVPQRGDGLGERLVAAHADAGPGPVVQVGMDTPQVTAGLLREVAAGLDECEAVLGPAVDGGWWVLGLRDPQAARALAEVPMSTADTGQATLTALRSAGLGVGAARMLRDVDVAEDAQAVAQEVPDSAFARAWAEISEVRQVRPGDAGARR